VKVHVFEVQWRSIEGESTCFRGTIEREANFVIKRVNE
jgi:hypothetical protein